jgi:hypothetical protein
MDENAYSVMNLRMPPDQMEKLKKMAASRRTTVSQLVRQGMEQFLRSEQENAEILRQVRGPLGMERAALVTGGGRGGVPDFETR